MSRSLRRARAAFLARLLRSEQRMREAYVRAAARIRRALTARPDATQTEIERVVLRELVRTTRQRLGIIERSTSDSARRGRIAQIAETAEALGRDDLGVRVTAQGPWTDTSRRRLNVAAASADGLTLPQRLRGLDRRTAEAIARELTAARQAAEGAKVAAQRLERVAGAELQQAVPRYVRDLAEAVRQAPSGSEVKRIVKAARERVLRRGSVAGSDFTIRGANRKLLAELSKPGVDVDRVVAEWVERKATYRARMIARTEGQRAFARAYVETAQANPRVEALKFNLSPSHPKLDVCDSIAAMDAFGLGPGVFPKDQAPVLPIHPNGMSFLSSVLVRPDGSSSITRTEPRAPHETLAAMPAERRREILGPGRARLFERAPTAVVRPDGTFRTLAGAERVAGRRRRRAASSV
ncbi:MAG: hypothetical protein H6721_26600 [Sandaracinus sp.]|nr:hypothetical protein [Sandaracinus sp.]